MHIKQILSILIMAFAVLSLYSCEQSATPEQPSSETTTSTAAAPAQAIPSEPSQFIPTASIQEIMLSIIDPSADYLWESVSVVSDENGIKENKPRTDEEWQAVRDRAVTLMEAANLLAIKGRRVVREGKKIQDEELEETLTSAQIQKLIDDDHAGFVSFAQALHETVRNTLKAIDDRDVDAFFMTGGNIDLACEACHTKYWYPNQDLPYGY